MERDGELWMVEKYVYVSVKLECVTGAITDIQKLNSSLQDIKTALGTLMDRNHTFVKIGDTLGNKKTKTDRVHGNSGFAFRRLCVC